jgi:hypothetical protein
MDKEKRHETLSGKPIAQKLLAKLQRRRLGKVANLAEVINNSAAAEELQRGIVGGLTGFHPAHLGGHPNPANGGHLKTGQ